MGGRSRSLPVDAQKSILNELYIENEARLVYYAICSAGERTLDPVVVREITTRRPDILAKLRETRTDGRVSTFFWDVPFEDGSVRKLNLRNITEFYQSMIGRARMNNIRYRIPGSRPEWTRPPV